MTFICRQASVKYCDSFGIFFTRTCNMKAIFAIGCLFLLAAAVRSGDNDEAFKTLKDDIKACAEEQEISEGNEIQ
ncbi:hypothetical protein E2986_12404 [Frieseomelitta varia]|uniref:Uncharacterized protein n=1 Tax=Frieseomelitta varia TaxID=561572 RepID=A0A833RVN5_9HYME|nr:hypothetical protein E2986_12404 [Frieseomelitta varia]